MADDLSASNKPIAHAVTSEAAIVIGVAEGRFGDKVGVFGSTLSGIGVSGRARAPEGLAGRFEGRVEVTESLRVRGIDVVAAIERLQQAAQPTRSLEAEVAGLKAINADLAARLHACEQERNEYRNRYLNCVGNKGEI